MSYHFIKLKTIEKYINPMIKFFLIRKNDRNNLQKKIKKRHSVEKQGASKLVYKILIFKMLNLKIQFGQKLKDKEIW
ncbi:hypothetical protein BKP44_06760 [Formosa algae]|nr:hypothetical protein BKP44_06760 [Formosa algae]